jgi:hypothetical protein
MSLSTKLVEEVDNLLNDWQSKQYMFTAHDVTSRLRKLGNFVKHRDILDFVHAKYDRGEFLSNYNRSDITIQGNLCRVFFDYFVSNPVELEYNLKNPDSNGGSASVFLPISVPSQNASVPANPQTPAVYKKLGKENILRLTAGLTRALGLSPGDVVDVKEDSNILFTKTSNPTNPRKVDQYGNVKYRVRSPKGTKYKLSLVGNQVIAHPN